MDAKKTIDSHTSFLNNRRVTSWLVVIDYLGFAAANSCQFRDVCSYYNAIEQVYLSGVVTILPNTTVDDIETIRKSYARILDFVEKNENAQTKKAIEALLQLTKEFNFKLTTGLQEREYLFRMGSRQAKGLKNINFLKGSIFNPGGNSNETEREDGDSI